jgi:hypothetical protein
MSFYDPTTGQFLTRDPMASITRSAYSYTNGSPLNATDPSGLWCTGGVSWGLGSGCDDEPVPTRVGAAAGRANRQLQAYSLINQVSDTEVHAFIGVGDRYMNRKGTIEYTIYFNGSITQQSSYTFDGDGNGARREFQFPCATGSWAIVTARRYNNRVSISDSDTVVTSCDEDEVREQLGCDPPADWHDWINPFDD